MSDVALQHITKRFKDVTALDDVSFSINDGEFFVLLGPTGAGKTTTLRVLAGLEKPDAGAVFFDEVNITGFTPADRDVAFVFQQYFALPDAHRLPEPGLPAALAAAQMAEGSH